MKKTLFLPLFVCTLAVCAQRALLPPTYEHVVPLGMPQSALGEVYFDETGEPWSIPPPDGVFLQPPADSSWSLVIRFYPLEGAQFALHEKAGAISDESVYGHGCLRYGVVDSSGVLLIPTDYLTLEFSEGLAIVGTLTKKGEVREALRRPDGKLVFPPSKARFTLLPGSKGNLIRVTEEATIAHTHGGEDDDVVEETSHFGLVNPNGKWVVPLGRMLWLGEFSEGLVAFWDAKTQLYGYLDTLGKVAISPQFGYADAFSGGKARVEKKTFPQQGDAFGEPIVTEVYIDRYGGEVPAPVAAVASPEEDNRSEIIHELTENEINQFREIYLQEYYLVRDSLLRITTLAGKVGLMHRDGRLLVSPGYSYVSIGEKGRAFIGTSEERGTAVMYDANGALIVGPGRYTTIEPIEGAHLWKVKGMDGSGRMGLLNALGQELMPLQFITCQAIEAGIVLLSREDGRDLLYLAGTGVVDSFLTFEPFAAVPGLSAYRFSKPDQIGKFGVCDAHGNVLIPNLYQEIEMQYGFYICHLDNQQIHALYSPSGTKMLSGNYEGFIPWTRHHVWVKQGGKWGLMRI